MFKKYPGTLYFFLLILVLTQGIHAQNSYRDRYQQPEKIMDCLGIYPGMIIGEAGAGEGYFTFKLSKRVGDAGKIYANDIDQDALRTIRNKCKQEGVKNIETLLGEVEDPLFPEAQMDMVVMMYVFHDLDKPVVFLKNILKSLKPGANVVIIDRDPDKFGYDRSHFMTRETVLKHVKNAGYVIDRIETFLVRDNIYILYHPDQ